MSRGQTLAIAFMTKWFRQPAHTDYRPDWMEGLELDAYWPDKKLALEFDGDQHSVPVFGEGAFMAQKYTDKRKRKICRDLNIILIRLEAGDLSKSGVKRRIKMYFCMAGRKGDIPKSPFLRGPGIQYLDVVSKRYRDALWESFRSPTIFRKSKYGGEIWKRKKAIKSFIERQ